MELGGTREMTTIKDMTPAELRIAIAEQLGIANRGHLEAEWFEGWTDDGKDGWSSPLCPRCKAHESCFDSTPCCPDWPNNIAEAYALEGQFTDYTSRRRYWSHLSDVVDPGNLMGDSTFGWAMVHATAEQRCRAWLMASLPSNL